MKKVLIMITVSLFPRLLAAQEINIDPLVGENWYGLYIQGHKSGYSVNSVAKDASGTVVVTEDAHIRVSMATAKQDMRIFSKRTYAPDGALVSIESSVDDPSGVSKFFARVEGNELALTTILGGESKTERKPKPKETIRDALKLADLAGKDAKNRRHLELQLVRTCIQNGAHRQEHHHRRRRTGVRRRFHQGVHHQDHY